MTNSRKRLDIGQLRAKLRNAQGQAYWRSLGEVAETEEFQRLLKSEFPDIAEKCEGEVGRRNFLRLMGASLALGGLTHCTRQPEERIFPFAQSPEQLLPGKPKYFASALTLGGYANGVLVESHMGRPTKIEGHPGHPASLGASDTFGQAAVLGLYDPDRSQVVISKGRMSSWLSFAGEVAREVESQRFKRGSGLRILTPTVTSPSFAAQIRALLAELPEAKWYQYEPVSRDGAREGVRRALGEDASLVYRFDRAAVVVSLGSDFLSRGPGHLRYARDFTSRRRIEPGADATATEMNRLYVAEASLSNTGAAADHRLRRRPSGIEPLARALAAALGVKVADPGARAADDEAQRWISALAADLRAHAGESMVIAGDDQPASVHALVLAINSELGNVGTTVEVVEPIEAQPSSHLPGLTELTREMAAGSVKLLGILGGNPVYDAPADLEFAKYLERVPFRFHLSLYEDETSRLCQWHVPEAHELEAWGDARAFDGTVAIQQPLILPLYDGRSASQVVAAMLGNPEADTHSIVRGHWERQLAVEGAEEFNKRWRQILHDGVIPGTQAAPKTARLQSGFDRSDLPGRAGGSDAGIEIEFLPDPCVWDGRFANLGWLQELPKPLSKLTWDNAACLSPATAERLGLATEDVIILRSAGREIEAPVWIQPGQADDTITLTLGYGRTRAGQVGGGVGFNAYPLRTSAAPYFAAGATLEKTARTHTLATTQEHHNMEGRHLVRQGTLETFRSQPDFVQHMGHAPTEKLSLFPEFEYDGYSWGMAIDLNSCIGCNACMVACQSENNVPVVGKEQVVAGREMHWLRIDRYFEGSLDDPETHHQPVACMHCENAPCEVVCPVGATVHSSEGLNEMVYNRCVGTRYCSNNCPYKVRRFNFFQYTDYETESLKLLNNPDVTVRTRGVMEKCSYCVQRIHAARIDAEKEGRPIGDGEVTTACQAVCPAEAITFGDLNDSGSRVAQLRADPRNYRLLTELNTEPRTSYLARIRNPNPALETAVSKESRGPSHHA